MGGGSIGGSTSTGSERGGGNGSERGSGSIGGSTSNGSSGRGSIGGSTSTGSSGGGSIGGSTSNGSERGGGGRVNYVQTSFSFLSSMIRLMSLHLSVHSDSEWVNKKNKINLGKCLKTNNKIINIGII